MEPDRGMNIEYEDQKLEESLVCKNKATSKCIEKICGISVMFPKTPYKIQEDCMTSIITALNNNQNAMIESPTGTGKTLSLLCSTLSWMRHQKLNNTEFSKESFKEEYENCIPKIKCIYTSRTHSQLNQVMKAVKQLKWDDYKPSVALLASRDHLCTNSKLSNLKGVALNTRCRQINNGSMNFDSEIDSESDHSPNENKLKQNQCKLKINLLKNQKENRLGDYNNLVHDIEDVKNYCSSSDICPYYFQRI